MTRTAATLAMEPLKAGVLEHAVRDSCRLSTTVDLSRSSTASLTDLDPQMTGAEILGSVKPARGWFTVKDFSDLRASKPDASGTEGQKSIKSWQPTSTIKSEQNAPRSCYDSTPSCN